jgi:hypothetical protein
MENENVIDWIDPKDQLPEEREIVICTIRHCLTPNKSVGGYRIAFVKDGKWNYYNGFCKTHEFLPCEFVDYWMHFPEPRISFEETETDETIGSWSTAQEFAKSYQPERSKREDSISLEI